MTPVAIRWTDHRQLQRCPAAVQITGDQAVILLNRDIFPFMPEYWQRFSLAHELGHYLLDTDLETLADAFALGLLHGTAPSSLKQSLRKLSSMNVPNARMQSLYNLCLLADRQRHKIQIP